MQHQYDNLGWQQDANGHVTTCTDDALLDTHTRSLPLGQTETTVRDVAGRTVSLTDFNGKTTTFTYDPVTNRLLSKSADPDTQNPDLRLRSQSVSFTYFPDGKRQSGTRTDGTGSFATSFTYDPVTDRLTSATSPNGTIAYGYDALGERTGLETQFGVETHVLQFGYDDDGRLVSVTPQGANPIATYSYDAVGNRAGASRDDGVSTSYQYDRLNRLTDLVNYTGTDPTVTADVLSSYHYDLRPDGKRSDVTDQNGAQSIYQYDENGRLTFEQNPYSGQTVGYVYDPVGNRLQKFTMGGPTVVYGYDDNDRLLSENEAQVYGYDNNGDTILSGTTGQVYDFEHHLIESGASQYFYDADGNRVSQTTAAGTIRYLVDSQMPYPEVLEERDGAGTLLARYEYGDDLIRMDRPDGEGDHFSYYLFDGLGSTRQLTDSTGAVTDTFDYEAFGSVVQRSGSTANSYLFNGQQFDSGLGLYYLRARYYNQADGRFWGQDPYAGSTEDPVSLHRYLYAGDDSVDGVDPLGLYTSAFGYAVEHVVQDAYTIQFPRNDVLFGQPTGVGSDGGLKPDIFDRTRLKYMEIKPLTRSGIAHAITQMGHYWKSFSGLGYRPDGSWSPDPRISVGLSVSLITVDEEPVLVFNVLGVLFYTTATDIQDRISTVQEYARAGESIGAVRRLLQIPSVQSTDPYADQGTAEATSSPFDEATFIGVGIGLIRSMAQLASQAELVETEMDETDLLAA